MESARRCDRLRPENRGKIGLDIVYPTIHWGYLLPVILPVGGAVLVLMWDAFLARGERAVIVTITLGTLAAALGTTLGVRTLPGTAASLGGMYLFDGFTQFVFIVILFASVLATLIAAAQRELESAPAGEYFGLILFATSGMMLMAATRNLLMIFVGLEVFSLSLYVLVGYLRARPEGNEASLKYFLLGSFASGFLLYGMALVYGAAGSIDLVEIATRLHENPASRGAVFLTGLGLMVVGLGFKVAAVPFYMWTPDVYEGAPTAVTAFMSVGPKAAAFAAFFRIVLSAGDAGAHLDTILWVMAAFTMSLANLVAIWQSCVKRMLAYSSIAHAGYLMVALVVSRANPELATGGFLYYMLVYTFINMGAFCVLVVASGMREEGGARLDDLAGLASLRPGLAAVMAVFMVSLSGLPPTGGFVAKFYVFSAALKGGYFWLAVIAALNSVVAVYYYLRVVVAMYMREPTGEEMRRGPHPGWSYAVAALTLAAAGALKLGIYPSPAMDFAYRSTLFFH